MDDAHPRQHALSDDDVELVAAAQETIRTGRSAGRTSVAAAVRGGTGRIYVALDCPSRMSGGCAEPAAIAAAWAGGETAIAASVACCFLPDLSDVVVISPCGACRERLWHHAPNARVIVRAGDGSLAAVAVAELFPFAELFPGFVT